MPALRQQLEQCLTGCVCLMGLGNVDYGDDGFGVRLAEELLAAGLPEGWQAVVAGTTPERWIGRVADGGCENLVFLDAVEFGGAPGSAVFLDSGEMAARFPQISTHKISLGLLAKWAGANGTTRAWLLGVQPESLGAGQQLTPTAQKTLDALCELLRGLHSPSRLEEPSALRPIAEVNV
ncbi:MAG: hydrogenase maturation protease [Candidatus Acidiferrales bacterium]|jgi:hydrogenase maturation protease